MTTIATTTGETRATTSSPDAPQPASLRVLPLGASDWPEWSAFVNAAPDATPFHHPTWLTAVELAFQHQPQHLVARRGDALVGVLPLFEVRSFLAGRLLVSVPYATGGGPIAEDAAARSALVDAAAEMAEHSGSRCLDLRSLQPATDRWPTVDGYVTFVRTLPDRAEDVILQLPRKARAAVRQARDRLGLTVQFDASLLPVVWKLYARSMRRLGSLNYPYRFFELLTTPASPKPIVSVVFDGETPIAGLVSFVFQDTVYPYFAGCDERRTRPGSNNLLYASLMEYAAAMGVRRFDFGRSRVDNAGAVEFKRNQGFEMQPLGYQRFVPPGRRAPRLSPSDPRYAIARNIWRRLPTRVTEPLGAWLSSAVTG